jgi:hypothetical protein
MTKLSPAAQAVMDAFLDSAVDAGNYYATRSYQIAAVLRAATADQNKLIDVPFSRIDQWEKIKGNTLSYWTAAQWGYQKAMSELLDIVTELEAHQ